MIGNLYDIYYRTTEMEATPTADNPLLVVPLSSITLNELSRLIQKIRFGRKSPESSGVGDSHGSLNPDLADRVAEFFVVQKVKQENVRAVLCSSMDGSFPLHECLTPDETTWWISGGNSMPEGRGREYVEFMLDSRNVICRLTEVQIKIPPMPAGPLSVREFEIEAPVENTKTGETEWKVISPKFGVQNATGYQRFELYPPIGVDVSRVRVVCLSNQISVHRNRDDVFFTYNCVGFFSIRFL